MRTLGILILLILLGVAPSAQAGTITYGFTDTQLGGTSQIGYTLGLTGGGCPPDCTTTVTVNSSGTPNPNVTPVYLGSLVFKFGGSTLLDLDAVGAETLPTAIPTGWGVVKDAEVDNVATSNLHNGAVPNGGFVGFYNTDLTANLINLSSSGTFTFTFDAHGVNTSSDPSLHNEYYTLEGSTVNFDTFLSETAEPLAATPEPSSLILAATALAGFVSSRAWRKRRGAARAGAR